MKHEIVVLEPVWTQYLTRRDEERLEPQGTRRVLVLIIWRRELHRKSETFVSRGSWFSPSRNAIAC